MNAGPQKAKAGETHYQIIDYRLSKNRRIPEYLRAKARPCRCSWKPIPAITWSEGDAALGDDVFIN